MSLTYLIFLVILIFFIYKKKEFIKHNLNKLFGIYVFLVLFLWSLPRIFTIGQIADFCEHNRIKLPLLLDLFRSFYLPSDTYFNGLIPVKLLPVGLFIGLLLLVFKLPQNNLVESLVSNDSEVTNISTFSKAQIFKTSIFIFSLLILKEFLYPYYFVQDDNHAQFFPKILVALQMIFNGELPFIDNYQFFGLPLYEPGTYAFFEPLIIFSFVVAKYLAQNIYMTLDIYAVLSLVIGSLVFGFSLRLLKVDPLVGMVAMISNSLCGYYLIAGRSWYYVLGISYYAPILLYLFLLAIKKENQSWKWFASSGIARGFFFYAGNVQFFMYGILIEALAYTIAAFQQKQKLKFLFNYISSLILTLGIISPLLIPQYMYLKEAPRGIEELIAGGGIHFDSLISSFLPYPLTNTPHPNYWPVGEGEKRWLMTSLYHIGFIWIACLLTGIAIYIKRGKLTYCFVALLAMFLLLMSGGSVSLIYPLKHYIPLVNKMFFAFKLYPFAVLIIILYGSLALSSILRKTKEYSLLLKRLLIISVLITVYILYRASDTSFYTYKEKPYPSLNSELKSNFKKDDIIYSFAIWRYDKEPYVTTLEHNYSCLFDVMCVNEYDPIMVAAIGSHPPPVLEYLKNLGITKVILQKIDGNTAWNNNAYYALSGLPVLYEDNGLILYDLNNPGWLLRLNTNSLQDTNLSQGNKYKVTYYDRAKIRAKVNLLEEAGFEYHNEYRPGYYLLIDGKKYEIKSSPERWCAFKIPAGKHNIEIGYMPKTFNQAVLIGIFLAVLSLFIYGLLNRRSTSFI